MLKRGILDSNRPQVKDEVGNNVITIKPQGHSIAP